MISTSLQMFSPWIQYWIINRVYIFFPFSVSQIQMKLLNPKSPMPTFYSARSFEC